MTTSTDMIFWKTVSFLCIDNSPLLFYFMLSATSEPTHIFSWSADSKSAYIFSYSAASRSTGIASCAAVSRPASRFIGLKQKWLQQWENKLFPQSFRQTDHHMHPQDPGSVLKIGSESGWKTGLTEIVKDPEEAEASDFLSSYYKYSIEVHNG